jgi:uncharacterized membrane protein
MNGFKAQPGRNAQSQTENNIRRIFAREDEALKARSRVQRIGDTIATQAGRPWCVLAHIGWFGVWILWNSPTVIKGKPFDPFPYPLLTSVVSLESIFLALFLLMSQNRTNRQTEQRAHLDLQINLLSESENTKMLQMLQALCAYHGLALARDPEVEQLSSQVEPEDVIAEINKHTPEQS